MKRQIPFVVPLLLALLLAAAGCGGCGARKGAEPEAGPLAFVSPEPRELVYAPEPARLGATVAGLERKRIASLAASMAGAKDAAQLVTPVVRQLGFDPRSPEGFAEAGIDGAKGIAIVRDEADAGLLAVGVADERRLEAWLAGLAGRQGASVAGTASWAPPAAPGAEPPAPIAVSTFAGPDGSVRIAHGRRGGYAVVATGADAVEAVGRALSRSRQLSLAASPEWRRLGGILGERDLVVWMPKGLANGRGPTGSGLLLGIAADASGVQVRGLIRRGLLEMAMLGPAGAVAGGELLGLLPADDFLAIRLGGDPQGLQPILEAVAPRGLAVRLRRAGIDPRTEIFGQLQPGVVVGFGLNPSIDLSAGIPTQLSVSRTNPFDFFTTTLYAKVKDPAKAQEVLEKLAAGASHFAMEVDREERNGAKVYRARWSAGEGMSWTLAGDTLVATGGPGMLNRAVERLGVRDAAGFAIADPTAKRIFDQAASAAHLDVPRLAKALREIPESAYGVGGFRIKEIVGTWADLLGEVQSVTTSFSVRDEGIVVDAAMGLK